MPTVSVVIPTYNAIGQIEPLLNQLHQLRNTGRVGAGPAPARWGTNTTVGAAAGAAPTQPVSGIEVILTDDASPDGSAGWLAEQYSDFTVIPGEKNVGFGANVMRGVQAASGDYLFLLNSDVELRGDPLTPLLALLEQEDSIFAAMPLIYNTHLSMVENLARLYCHRGLCWHTELAEQSVWTKEVREQLEGAGPRARPAGESANAGGAHGRPPASPAATPIPAVLCGAAFLCRRERFLQLGGFDPRYQPFYWEDVALGFAAARRGWRAVTVPQALVIHRHSESISAKVGERKLRYLMLNQLRFVQQFRGDLRSSGLRQERLWWLARSARALAKGDLAMTVSYLRASLT
jgi:GT2 family glycosyltransferase